MKTTMMKRVRWCPEEARVWWEWVGDYLHVSSERLDRLDFLQDLKREIEEEYQKALDHRCEGPMERRAGPY